MKCEHGRKLIFRQRGGISKAIVKGQRSKGRQEEELGS